MGRGRRKAAVRDDETGISGAGGRRRGRREQEGVECVGGEAVVGRVVAMRLHGGCHD